MEKLFLQLVMISLTASIMIALVGIARLLWKNIPKTVLMVLWAIIGLRLLIPVTFDNAFSALPNPTQQVQEITKVDLSEFNVNDTNFIWKSSEQSDAQTSGVDTTVSDKTTSPSLLQILAIIWMSGILAISLYSLGAYIRLRIRLRRAMEKRLVKII